MKLKVTHAASGVISLKKADTGCLIASVKPQNVDNGNFLLRSFNEIMKRVNYHDKLVKTLNEACKYIDECGAQAGANDIIKKIEKTLEEVK